MDQELKQYLDREFTQVRERITHIDHQFEQVGERFTHIDHQFDQVREQFTKVREELERTETRLLSEFWKWSRTSDQRMRRVESGDATTAERLTILEERIFTLERKALGSKD